MDPESIEGQALRQINEVLASKFGVGLIHDFGEIGREKKQFAEVSYHLHLRRFDQGVMADFRSTTHTRRKNHTSVPLVFDSFDTMRGFFSGLPTDPLSCIESGSSAPPNEQIPFFDRFFLKCFGGLKKSRLLRDRRTGRQFRAQLWACLEKRDRSFFYLMASTRGPQGRQQSSLALTPEIFNTCVSLILEFDEGTHRDQL